MQPKLKTIYSEDKLTKLEKELQSLRSIFISFVGQDREGIYQPTFVKKLFETSLDIPCSSFDNEKFFLKELES